MEYIFRSATVSSEEIFKAKVEAAAYMYRYKGYVLKDFDIESIDDESSDNESNEIDVTNGNTMNYKFINAIDEIVFDRNADAQHEAKLESSELYKTYIDQIKEIYDGDEQDYIDRTVKAFQLIRDTTGNANFPNNLHTANDLTTNMYLEEICIISKDTLGSYSIDMLCNPSSKIDICRMKDPNFRKCIDMGFYTFIIYDDEYKYVTSDDFDIDDVNSDNNDASNSFSFSGLFDYRGVVDMIQYPSNHTETVVVNDINPNASNDEIVDKSDEGDKDVPKTILATIEEETGVPFTVFCKFLKKTYDNELVDTWLMSSDDTSAENMNTILHHNFGFGPEFDITKFYKDGEISIYTEMNNRYRMMLTSCCDVSEDDVKNYSLDSTDNPYIAAEALFNNGILVTKDTYTPYPEKIIRDLCYDAGMSHIYYTNTFYAVMQDVTADGIEFKSMNMALIVLLYNGVFKNRGFSYTIERDTLWGISYNTCRFRYNNYTTRVPMTILAMMTGYTIGSLVNAVLNYV